MMLIIELHDKNNPDRIVPFDAADFSIALPSLGGSLLKLKSDGGLIPVEETPDQILKLMKDQGAC